jgi:hypothetical protein
VLPQVVKRVSAIIVTSQSTTRNRRILRFPPTTALAGSFLTLRTTPTNKSTPTTAVVIHAKLRTNIITQ